MTRTDEQELVLGNKQLLSAFFVVAALLGVFFTMGYIIGRNTGAGSTGAKDASAAIPPATEVVSRQPHDAAAVAPPVTQAAEPDNKGEDSERPVVTRPVRPSPPEAQETAPEEKSSPTKRESATKAEEAPAGPVAVESAPGHQYLQVMAVKRPVADNMVRLLRERGFPALIGESSKPELYRVLVGPFSDTPSLAKSKSELKAAGFESVISK